MYEGSPHIWSDEGVGRLGDDAPTARLADLIDPNDPALQHISQALTNFRAADVSLTEEIVKAAIKLGRAEHARWSAADGNGFKAAPLPRQGAHAPVVYYVRRGTMVKIGTTTNLHERMRAILPEEILATEPGGQKTEFARHRQFSALRVDGQREWFHAGAALQDHVQRVRAQHGAPEHSLPVLPT
ncbi:GIY-YIG nuclease family protein [Streptomyces cucumeris]|uniref:GIY-YIG nuclease family protein n=1 Tax=Streptomyces cucumeris TaxID=2962890 RepID=UPI0020C86BE6|nr:GIY-YIG nuclease family protein [Streptomyces sp. NEAU-Y11]MCP9209296.1 GIY-YIG nuclease family protein [Streptomyces sp. NEAU-Y11]